MSDYSLTILADGPVAYWRLGEAAGATANDETTSNLDLTYSGSPTLGATGLLTGDADTAVTFSASADQRAIRAYSGLLPSGNADRSVEFWFSCSSLSSQAPTFFGYGNDGGNGNNFTILYDYYYGDCFVLSTYGAFGTWDVALTSAMTGVIDGNRHHVVVTYTGSTRRAEIWVDNTQRTGFTYGSDLATVVIAGNIAVAGLPNYGGDGYRFNGTLDEVAVYDYALSSTQVNAHYTVGITGEGGEGEETGGPFQTNAFQPDAFQTTSSSPLAMTPSGVATAFWASVTVSGSENVAHAGRASGTVTAHAATAYPTQSMATGCATGVGAARVPVASLRMTAITTATGTGAAYGIETATLEAAVATGTAHGPTTIAARPTATASGSALNATAAPGTRAAAVAATATGAAANAIAATAAGGWTLEAASATGTAQSPSVSGRMSVPLVTATGAAQGTDAKVGATNITAAGTGAAANASAVTVTGAYATSVLATATGAAAASAAKVGVAAGAGAGTGEANSLDSSTTFTAGTASATGAGYGTVARLSVVAGVASGVGTALPLTFALRPQGGIATSTGAALAGSSALGVPAGAASASGTGHDVTWSGTSRVSVTAGVATGTGLARTSKRGHSGGTPPRGRGHHWTPRAEAATVS